MNRAAGYLRTDLRLIEADAPTGSRWSVGGRLPDAVREHAVHGPVTLCGRPLDEVVVYRHAFRHDPDRACLDCLADDTS